MPEYRFSLTCIFPYKDKIDDSVLIRNYTGQRKSIFWHILCSNVIISGVSLANTQPAITCLKLTIETLQ